MPNTIATPDWTTKEVGRNYLNKIVFVKNVKRTYDGQYKQAGAKVGNTIHVRLPQRFVVNDGQALQVQAIYDRTVPVSLTNQKQVGFGYSSAQATTELDAIRERYVMPGAEALASAADILAFENVYKEVYNSIGTPGTTTGTTLAFGQANVKLTDMAAPTGDRKACLDPLGMVTLANAASTLFNPSSKISEAFSKGMFGRDVMGINEWYEDANRPVHTTGTFTACTPLINTASQTGSSLITDGWASSATSLKEGDIFTVAGVYSVNPQGYQSTGRLQQFTVTADISDTTGDMTIAISPPIITSGSLQTVTNSPADGAAITVWSAVAADGTLATTAAPQGLVFVPDAFAFVTADLEKPSGGAVSSFVRSTQSGMSIRYAEQWDIRTDQNPSRLDILIGAAALRPEWAVRVQG